MLQQLDILTRDDIPVICIEVITESQRTDMHRDRPGTEGTNRTVAVELLAILNVGAYPGIGTYIICRGTYRPGRRIAPLRNIYPRTVGKKCVAPEKSKTRGEFNCQLAEFLRETNRQVVDDCAHIG